MFLNLIKINQINCKRKGIQMGYTVKDLLESNNFSEMQLISDDSGIGREIKGVRIIEVPDMEKFLGG
jgi:hypothetical protein